MHNGTSWEIRFIREINQAEAARSAGNEGKARVCARRAAGIIVHEVMHRQGIEYSDPSAYVQLKYFISLPQLSPHLREIINHFLIRITPDGNLPVDADLVQEARWLANELLSYPHST